MTLTNEPLSSLHVLMWTSSIARGGGDGVGDVVVGGEAVVVGGGMLLLEETAEN